ncbi:unnamed protein product [Caenorhabditis sp. 36 PRJEB53466]|nr:unnamed protein product [Caenorhabditis sp. 36 PRJEB53466]
MKRPGEVTPITTPSKIHNWVLSEKTPEKKRGPPMSLKPSPTKQIVKRNTPRADPIKTYVFFDLECTGLIKNDEYRNLPCNNYEKSDDFFHHLEAFCMHTRTDELPHITEMSFVAISRETFDEIKEKRKNDAMRNDQNPEEKRILAEYVATNTHTRQLNPLINEDKWREYENTRNNDKKEVLVHPKKLCLRNNTFKQEWPAVVNFLDSLQKPVLLVGHNALRYDLRVIYGEMQRNGLRDDCKLPEDVFFMDSLLMAKQIENEAFKKLTDICKFIDFSKISPKEEDEEVQITDSSNRPIGRPVASSRGPANDHPRHTIKWDEFSVALRKRIPMNGFVRTENGGWTFKYAGTNRYKLEIIYKEVVGGEYTAHYAQQDAEALMHTCLSYGNDFTKFADVFAAPIPF